VTSVTHIHLVSADVGPLRKPILGALLVSILGVGAALGGEESQPDQPRKWGHARALSMVLDHAFVEPGGVTAEAEARSRARATGARVWRVRAVEGHADRFDVIFYIGDRPACVWRADVAENRVVPDGCTLELWGPHAG
jgi:hypothetical protein